MQARRLAARRQTWLWSGSLLSYLSFFPSSAWPFSRLRAGHGALTEVRQILSLNVFAPGVAEFRMSTPLSPGKPFEICMGGFPATTLRRKIFPETPAARMIPFVVPRIVLSSMTLSWSAAATRPMPKLLPCASYPFPLSRLLRSRLWLAPAVSHMPPQGFAPLPFRTERLRSTSLSELAIRIIPEKQLVDIVTCVTREPVVLSKRILGYALATLGAPTWKIVFS